MDARVVCNILLFLPAGTIPQRLLSKMWRNWGTAARSFFLGFLRKLEQRWQQECFGPVIYIKERICTLLIISGWIFHKMRTAFDLLKVRIFYLGICLTHVVALTPGSAAMQRYQMSQNRKMS